MKNFRFLLKAKGLKILADYAEMARKRVANAFTETGPRIEPLVGQKCLFPDTLEDE